MTRILFPDGRTQSFEKETNGVIIAESISKSLLKKAADKDDVADQVLTFCKTDTTTGQVLILDSGRLLSY